MGATCELGVTLELVLMFRGFPLRFRPLCVVCKNFDVPQDEIIELVDEADELEIVELVLEAEEEDDDVLRSKHWLMQLARA